VKCEAKMQWQGKKTRKREKHTKAGRNRVVMARSSGEKNSKIF